MDIETTKRLAEVGGHVRKHGWRESGNRRVGERGRAWHIGACFGAGWPAFEKNAAGTWAFVAAVVFPTAMTIETALSRLRARPAVLHCEDWDSRASKYVSVEVRPGEGKAWTIEGYVDRYERELADKTREAERELRLTKIEGDRLCVNAETWFARELRDKPPKKGPVKHAHSRFRFMPVCGSRGDRIHFSETDDGVTCSRCLKRLGR
jgi:hypothetical protein